MTILDSKGSVVSDKWIAEQTSRINDILELFDIKSSEHVPKEEVPTILRALGVFASEEAMLEILMNLEVGDDPDEVSFREVKKKALELIASEKWTIESCSIIMQAFQTIDKEKKGYIKTDNLISLLKTQDALFENEIKAFIRVAKEPHSDEIYYEDYVALFSKLI